MADDKMKFLMRIDPDTDRKIKTAPTTTGGVRNEWMVTS